VIPTKEVAVIHTNKKNMLPTKEVAVQPEKQVSLLPTNEVASIPKKYTTKSAIKNLNTKDDN
jgi:hypothetical protein